MRRDDPSLPDSSAVEETVSGNRAFLTAGGYHHHLGLNTWHSKGGSPHRKGDSGLEKFKIMLSSAHDLEAVSGRFPDFDQREHSLTVRDPGGIPITLELQNTSTD